LIQYYPKFVQSSAELMLGVRLKMYNKFYQSK